MKKPTKPESDQTQDQSDSPQVQQGHPLFDWRPLFFTLLLFALYYTFSAQSETGPKEIPYTQCKQQLMNDQLAAVMCIALRHSYQLGLTRLYSLYSSSGVEKQIESSTLPSPSTALGTGSKHGGEGSIGMGCGSFVRT